MTYFIIRENFIVARDKETGKVRFDINFKKLSGHRCSIQEYKYYLINHLKYYDDYCNPYFTVSILPKEIVRVEINSRDCHFSQSRYPSTDSTVRIVVLENSSESDSRVFSLFVREKDNRVHIDIDICQRKMIL